MENPIRKYINTTGLPAQKFAIAIGVNGAMVYHYLRGIPANMSPKFAWKLTKLGIDPGEAMMEYSRWRKEEAQKVIEEVKPTMMEI